MRIKLSQCRRCLILWLLPRFQTPSTKCHVAKFNRNFNNKYHLITSTPIAWSKYDLNAIISKQHLIISDNPNLSSILMGMCEPKIENNGRLYQDSVIGALLSLSVLPRTATSLHEFFDNPMDQVSTFKCILCRMAMQFENLSGPTVCNVEHSMWVRFQFLVRPIWELNFSKLRFENWLLALIVQRIP